MFTFLRRLFGFLLLLASLGLLAWGLWPAQVAQAAQALVPSQMQLPPSTLGEDRPGIQSVPGLPPAVPENRRVVLDTPVQMREGDAEVIRLTLEVDAEGNLTPTALMDGHTTTEEKVQIPNVYDTHSVQVEARLDLPNATVTPPEPVSLPLQAGQKASFTWTIKPGAVGSYRGAIWLTLQFTPLAGGEEIRQALTSLPVGVEVVNLFGIGGPTGRIMGIVGSALGSVISLDDVIKFIFGRRRKKKTQSRRR
jgi:hypothetical protein